MVLCPANGCGRDFSTDRGLNVHLAKTAECRASTLLQAQANQRSAETTDMDTEDVQVYEWGNQDPFGIDVDVGEKIHNEVRIYRTEDLEDEMADQPYDIEEYDIDDFSDFASDTASSCSSMDGDPMHVDGQARQYSAFSAPAPDGTSARYYIHRFADGPKKGERGNTPYANTKAAEPDPRNPTYPFAGVDEWQLARWLTSSGLSAAKIDEFLNLSWVCSSYSQCVYDAHAPIDIWPWRFSA